MQRSAEYSAHKAPLDCLLSWAYYFLVVLPSGHALKSCLCKTENESWPSTSTQSVFGKSIVPHSTKYILQERLHRGQGYISVISAGTRLPLHRVTSFHPTTITNTNPPRRYGGVSLLVCEKSEVKMTHDRLVDLTTKLHQTSRLSTHEAQEFAKLIGRANPELEGVAFRLVTQTCSLEDAERFSVACKLLFGCVLTRRVQ